MTCAGVHGATKCGGDSRAEAAAEDAAPAAFGVPDTVCSEAVRMWRSAGLLVPRGLCRLLLRLLHSCGGCGEFSVSDAASYRRLAMVLPTWARRCLKRNHEVSLLDKPNGRIEVFCGKCRSGAGQGEILTPAQTELLLRHF